MAGDGSASYFAVGNFLCAVLTTLTAVAVVSLTVAAAAAAAITDMDGVFELLPEL